MPKSKDPIVVTGDVTVDWLEVTTPPIETDEGKPEEIQNWQTYVGTRMFARPGGALLLARFIRCATNREVLSPELKRVNNVPPDRIVHSMARLDRFPYSTRKKDDKNFVYRVKGYKGYAGPYSSPPSFLKVKNDDPKAGTVVLDDASNGFRDAPKKYWPAALVKGNPLVVLKMSHPFAQGSLWEKLQKNHADRLIVVISADDLRRSGAKISRQLSWERTAQEFVWQMASNPHLISLNNCGWLVVRFGVDGAILYTRRRGVVESRLFFDPRILEGGFNVLYPGKMFGLTAAFVAALTGQICDKGWDGLEEGVRQGILSARRFYQLGFGKELAKLDYPGKEIFTPPGGKEPAIADIPIPHPAFREPADGGLWCILDDVEHAGLETVASNYVLYGKDPALDRVPVGEFGKLRTVDRFEIESYRSIQNLMREYVGREKVKKPLCTAVFGSPGSGKSFGVTQVAESVAPGEIEKLEFNLSQFNSLTDLISAFHKVRDVALSEKIPLVFFDEFDSDFNGKLGWLKYFLAPMNDGEFRDGETVHPLGKAIFVFAGGTCSTYAEFCGEKRHDQKETAFVEAQNDVKTGSQDKRFSREFRDAKGTDFVSRLRGFVNVKGPNPVGEDGLYLIRRALLLRSLFERTARDLFDGKKKLRIDPGVLRALIKVPEYKHGVRSMLAIIEMSMLAGRKSFEQAALPPAEQLELHVDSEIFSRLVVRDVLLGSAREVLGKAIHEKFRKDHKGEKTKNDPSMRFWKKLSEDLKESNRRQADHIPVKLKAVGCEFAPVVSRKPESFEFTDEEIEIMAKMEHERFVRERFLQGWSLGPKRNHKKKISPCLVPWEDPVMTQKMKDYDRKAVRAIPGLLAKAGFKIYRLK